MTNQVPPRITSASGIARGLCVLLFCSASVSAFAQGAPHAADGSSVPGDSRPLEASAQAPAEPAPSNIVLTDPNPTEPETIEPSPEDSERAVVPVANLDEGFGLRSGDGSFGIRLGGLFAARGYHEFLTGPDLTRAELRLARIALSGHAFGQTLRWFTQLEMAGGARLLDLELTVAPRPEFVARVGRFRTPFSRQFIMPLTSLALVERSAVSDFFRANRDTGVSLEGRLFGGKLEYRGGIYDENLDSSPLVLGRIAFDPLGAMAYDETTARVDGPTRLSFGLAGYRVSRQRQSEQLDPMTGQLITVTSEPTDRRAIGGDVAFRVGPVDALAEVFFDRREAPDGTVSLGAGAYGQVAVFVLPGLLQLAARYDWLTPSRDATLRGMQRVELGGSLYFLQGRLKVQPRYQFTDIPDSIAASLQSAANARTGHLVDLQLLLSI